MDRLGGDAAGELGRVLDDAEEKLRAPPERCAAALKTAKALREAIMQVADEADPSGRERQGA